MTLSSMVKSQIGNLQLQTQLIFFSIFTIIIICIIGYLIFMLQIDLVNTIYKNSTKIAAQRQIWNQMVLLQQRQVNLMETFQSSIKNQMTHVNKLIYLNLTNYNIQLEQFSLNSEPDRLIKSYNILNTSLILMYKEFPGQYLIHEWIPLIYNYDQIIDVNQMFWYEQNKNVFTYYNVSNTDLNKFYNFSDQIWYYNWVSFYQTAKSVSEARQLVTFQPVTFSDQSYYSFSTGLFDATGQQNGVLTSQFKISDFQSISLSFQLKTVGYQYFLTKDGRYILQQNDSYVLASIYNQTVTGYDLNDWEAIKNNNLQNSTCQYQGAQNMLCRYNALLKMDTIISLNPILNNQFYLVSIAFSEQYLKYVDDVFLVLLNKITNYQENFIIIICSVLPLIIIIIVISIKIITRPLTLLRTNIILKILKQSNQQQNIETEQDELNQLYKQKQIRLLIESYRNLIFTNQKQKINNLECRYIQNLKYNSNRYENYSQFDNIVKATQQIPKKGHIDISIFLESLKLLKGI